jgi:hypothetical protein
MNSRKDFLKELFRSLDANGIAFCVLRNYEGLINEGATADIDLLVEKRDLGRFSQSLQAAAVKSGHRFVHHARYVNHSCVFWSVQSNFTRIDFDKEIRWRLFPILSAGAILATRQKREGFYIPHPVHESAVLFSQAMWTGRLDERYRLQLARLYDACGDKEELRRTYNKAFGGAADKLVEFHSQIEKREFTRQFCSALKRSVILKTFKRPAGWRDFATNAISDIGRLWKRLLQPAGISLLFISSAQPEKNLDAFMRQIEFLFPAQKCFVHTVDLTENSGKPKGWGLKLELQRLRALFKGGLCVQFYRLAKDADMTVVTNACSHRLYPSRCFVCTEDSSGRACLSHVGTGYRAGNAEVEKSTKTDFSALLIGFISTVLEKENNRGIAGRKLVQSALSE